jgi:polyisoprenoid-binding protein YceI
MARFEPPAADCRVFTYKEGLLSPVAHDLEIEVTRFHVEVDGAVSARFDAASLRVVRSIGGTLSARDRAEIERNIRDHVLHAARYPWIEFRSTEIADHTVRGVLSLCGRERPLTVEARREGERTVVEATLHQPDFGIKPFTAMLGTLRIRADVRVRVSVPAP